MSIATKKRESTSSSVEIEGTCVSKNLDEAVSSSPRKVDTRDKRETTRDYKRKR